jgi:hypothetical protein
LASKARACYYWLWRGVFLKNSRSEDISFYLFLVEPNACDVSVPNFLYGHLDTARLELNYIAYLEFVTHFDLSEKMKGIAAAKKSVLKRAD